MARKIADCRRFASESNCSLTIIGEEDDEGHGSNDLTTARFAVECRRGGIGNTVVQ